MDKGCMSSSISNFKKKISILLIVSLFLTNFTHLNLYASEMLYQYIPELEVDAEYVDEGMFYMPYNSFEVNENESDTKYLFKILRKGNIDKVEKVKLSMVDITGKYNRDYSIKVIDKLAFNEKVQNKSVSKSVDEYMRDSDYEEYNYSDAIVDGTLLGDDIMSDEERENYTMSDEEKEQIINDAENIFDELGVDSDIDKIDKDSFEEEIEKAKLSEDKEESEEQNIEEETTVEESNVDEKIEYETIEEQTTAEQNNDVSVSGFSNSDIPETNINDEVAEDKNNTNKNNEEETKYSEETVESETVNLNNNEVNSNEELDESNETKEDNKSIDESITEEQIDTTTNDAKETEQLTTTSEESNEINNKHIASISDIEYSDEVVEFNKKIATISLTEAYEKITGLQSDRKHVIPDRTLNSYMPNVNSLNDFAFMQNSIDTIEEELKSAYVVLEFKESQTEKLIELSINNDNKYRGNRQISFNLSSVEESQVAGLYKSLTLIIHDDEEIEPSYINFIETHYEPENGYLTVTVERTGDTSSIATCMIDSEDNTAIAGRDYSKVHAELLFGMGISVRKIKIPIVSKYVKNKSNFKLKLQEPKGALIGNRATTICTIDKSDKNFEYALSSKNNKNNDISSFGSSNDKNSSDLSKSKTPTYGAGGTDYDLDSVILGDPINLEKCLINFQSKKANKSSSHYFINDGKGFYMYLENHDAFGESAYYFFDIDTASTGYHYDWSGVQFDWSCSKENADIKLKEWMDNTNSWRNFYDKEDTGFGRKTENFLLQNDKMTKIYFWLRREGGCWGKSPTIKIESIKPILKMYKINLIASDIPALINDDGISTTAHKYAKYALTSIEGDKADHTAVGWTGKTVTVKLDNTVNNPFYIKKLWVKNNNSESDKKLVAQNYDTESTSISFKIDQDFANKHKNLIKKIDRPGGGFNGEFSLCAELGLKQSVVKVVKDDRVNVKIWNTTAQSTTGDTYNWTYNIGDVLHFNVDINSSYKNLFECNGINIYRIKPYSPDWLTIRKPLTGEDFFPLDSEYSEIRVEPLLSRKNNSLIVRVPKNKIEYFDQNYGIFNNSKHETKNFYEFYVESNSEKIAGNYFDFKAKCIDDTKVPVWYDNHKENIKYTQNTHYYRGSIEPEDNIIYLTCDEADDRKYSVTGTVYYEEATIGGKTTDRYWQVAPYVGILIDDYHFAYANDKGEFETISGAGKSGYYKQLKVVSNSFDRYINVLLKNDNPKTNTFVIDYNDGERSLTEDIYSVDSGEILISNVTKDHPFITGVKSLNDKGSSFGAVYINDKITILEASVSPKKADGSDYTYTYIDENGSEVTAIETVKRVEFVVVDMKDHSIKKVIEATNSSEDKTKWTVSFAFARGNYSEYMSGDKLYARVVTNRKVGDGKGDDIENSGTRIDIPLFNETTYQAIPTTLPFIEEDEKEPHIVTIEFPEHADNELKLPVIGSLESMFNMAGMSFKISVDGDRVRLYMGKKFNGGSNRYGPDGKPMADNGNSDISLSNFKKEIDDMTKQINESGTKRLGAMTLGVASWSFQPVVGIYFEFMLTYDPSAIISQEYVFTGAGGYFGGVLDFKYTYYFLIYGIPFYVGGNINLSLMAEIGISISGGEKIKLGDPTQSYFNDLLSNANFEFLIKAVLKASAYVGVGICGALGARGGFQLDFTFIWNPAIKLKYPSVRPVGFAITGSIKFWLDAGFMSLDIPVYSWPNFLKLGYFKDIDNVTSISNKNSGDNLYGLDKKSALGELKIKPRFKVESNFVADSYNENKKGSSNTFGGTFVEDNTRPLVEGVYDSSEAQLMKYRTSKFEPEKALLVYLDDEPTQGDLDRTTLKYSVYNSEDGSWTEPKKVWEASNTADFSPVLCDCKTNLLLAWAKRPEPVDENTPKADLFKKMEIYTAYYNIYKDEFNEPERMTYDDSYDYYPQLAYSSKNNGQVYLYYFKNDDVSEINTSEDLLNNIQPEVNGAYLVYMINDDPDGAGKRWLIEMKDYRPYEYIDIPFSSLEEREEYFKNMRGQRIKDLSIKIGGYTDNINDPNISDYVTETITFINASENDIEELYQRAKEAKESHDLSLLNDILNQIERKTKYYNVVAYIVDSDGDPTTKNDTDLFLKLSNRGKDNEEVHTLRLTFNNTPDMMPKILKNDDGAYLFWIQNESTIKMVQLDNIIKKANDEDHQNKQIDIGEVNIMTVDKDILSDKINNFVPFTDSNNNVYITWQQDSNDNFTISNDDAEVEFKQDLYVAGLIKHGSEDDEVMSWSNPVRLTDNGKVNNLPTVVDINNQLILVNNQYNLVSDDESYIITNSNLQEIVYSKKSSLFINSIINNVDTIYDDESIKYKTIIKLHNSGLFAAEGFDYNGQVMYDGTVITDFSGSSDDLVLPGNETIIGSYSYGENPTYTPEIYFTLNKEQQKHLDKVEVEITAIEHNVQDYGVISKEKAFDLKETFTFASLDGLTEDEYGKLTVDQIGDSFVIKGILQNTGSTDSNNNEKIYVIDQENWDVDIASSDYIDLPMGSQMQFEIPIDSNLIPNLEKGVKDLVVYVKNDDGVKLSDYEIVTINARQPFGFKVNGGIEEIKLKEGEDIDLSTTYVPNEKYINATILYSIANSDVAQLSDNKLLAINKGTTKLTLTTKEFGGSKDINVTVLSDKEPIPTPAPTPSPNSNTTKSSSDSSGSSSDSGSSTGINQKQNNPTVTETQITKTSNYVMNNNQGKWIYDPATNKFKFTITIDNQDVLASNVFITINEFKTESINGINNNILTSNTYYFDNFGNMVTGWVKTSDNKWYYFENEKTFNEGKMVKGWKKILNDWYYFNEDGSMLTSSLTVDGYFVGPEGKLIQ